MNELTLEATLENLPRLTAWVDEALEALDCPVKAQMQIDVAIDEIFGNIARYAYPGGTGRAAVRIDCDPGTGMAVLTFLDEGIPFDPLAQAEPDTTLDLDDRPIGGLGIFLVKRTMDEVTYRREDGRNILCLKKRIRPAGAPGAG